jgi:capsular exopolysaccharide synthesis family protein
MSYIFDALQRSQAERPKTDGRGSQAAIELLERAERQATAQRATESLEQEQPAETGIDHQGPLFSGEGLGPRATDSSLIAITNALQEEERREIFSQFQTLEASRPKSSRLVSLGDCDSPATEAFHLLGVRLRNLRRERELKSLLITSTIPKEGKSVVASNLACTLGSGARQKVLLVDGDVRRPMQSEIFGLAQVPGLCNYLLGKRSLTACLYHLPKAGIWILPAGNNQGDFRAMIQSPRLPNLMASLNSWFDWIVIDSPPVLPMVDTSLWARFVDGILLVTRNGTTRKRKLQKGLEALDPNKLIGALLNASKSTRDGYDYYYGRAPEASKLSGSAVD